MCIYLKIVNIGDRYIFGFGGFWGRLGVKDYFFVGFESLFNCDEYFMIFRFYIFRNYSWIVLVELESFGIV